MPSRVALDALGRLIFNSESQRIIGHFDWTVLRSLLEARHRRPLLADLGMMPASEQPARRRVVPETQESLADRLARLPADMRKAELEDLVRDEVAAVLGLSADDPIPPEVGFFDLGMDSLTSVELRRRLERLSGLSLPSSLTFSYPNLHAMANLLARELCGATESQNSFEADVAPHPELTALDDLTDVELEARLLARLQEVR